MPRFEPFAAIRYAPGTDLDAVIAPPYDVLSPTDVASLAARDPHNIVVIDVPEQSEAGYHEADARLREWLAEGVLVTDDRPTLTIYRMVFTDATGRPRTISGVLGGLEVVDEGRQTGSTTVLPHERTTPKATTDRLDLMRATGAQTSPVWGLSLARGLTDALAEPGEPVGSMTADGVTHAVERVDDPERIAAIQEILAADDVLIADGHHRYSVSRSYRDEQRRRAADGSADCTLAFVNELAEEQLSIEAIHRVYDSVTADDLRRDLERSFEIGDFEGDPTPQTLTEMADSGRLVLVTPQRSYWLTPKPGAFEGVRELDGALLEHALADSAAEVSYQHGLSEVLDAVGAHAAAVLIRPTSLDEIIRTAREGLLMPPKSTFFTPKLRTGFVLRPSGRPA